MEVQLRSGNWQISSMVMCWHWACRCMVVVLSRRYFF